jgi:hypothetical protein
MVSRTSRTAAAGDCVVPRWRPKFYLLSYRQRRKTRSDEA